MEDLDFRCSYGDAEMDLRIVHLAGPGAKR